jgi:hypothetical protein
MSDKEKDWDLFIEKLIKFKNESLQRQDSTLSEKDWDFAIEEIQKLKGEFLQRSDILPETRFFYDTDSWFLICFVIFFVLLNLYIFFKLLVLWERRKMNKRFKSKN